MKFLAVLLIGCIVFLSSFSGMVNTSPVAAKMDCCKKAAGKAACHHKPAKNEAGGCEKPGCAMLFSCSICGFIPVGTLTMPSNFSLSVEKPAPLYKTSDLSAYHKADWKPPKTC
jgi:hypothetical protein